MNEVMLAVPASLAGSIASISRWRKPSSHETIVRLPDTAASIVIHRSTRGDVKLAVVGPIEHAYYKSSAALEDYWRITFRVGHARRALGTSLAEVQGGSVDLGALWGPSVERATSRETVAHVLAVLDRRARDRPPITSVIAARAVRAIADAADSEAASVRAVAGRIGVSERFLRNAFRDEIGVSPKRYARIMRIRRAATAAMTTRVSLADLAMTQGFFDQAHLNAEFRALLGTTPKAFRAKQFPTASNCAA
jgi:AraC-like DNA-binding protein